MWLIRPVPIFFLACGSHVVDGASDSTTGDTLHDPGTGGGITDPGTGGAVTAGCDADAGDFPATTTTPDCPADMFSDCTNIGQSCTWTTGSSSVTYTCEMFMTCIPMTFVQWTSPVTTGDGCGGSACCVPCAQAKPGDACDALGYTCAYEDPNPNDFPGLIGLVCSDHQWSGVAQCEN